MTYELERTIVLGFANVRGAQRLILMQKATNKGLKREFRLVGTKKLWFEDGSAKRIVTIP